MSFGFETKNNTYINVLKIVYISLGPKIYPTYQKVAKTAKLESGVVGVGMSFNHEEYIVSK